MTDTERDALTLNWAREQTDATILARLRTLEDRVCNREFWDLSPDAVRHHVRQHGVLTNYLLDRNVNPL